MSKFDWHSGDIELHTVIDAHYRNTQKVRRFFHAHCGSHFKFDRDFMAWMKSSQGKTMDDAVKHWKSLHQ